MDEQDRTEYKMQADIDLIMYIKLYIYIFLRNKRSKTSHQDVVITSSFGTFRLCAPPSASFCQFEY